MRRLWPVGNIVWPVGNIASISIAPPKAQKTLQDAVDGAAVVGEVLDGGDDIGRI